MLMKVFADPQITFAKWLLILKVRGVGLVLAIEFAANKETCEAYPAKWGMNWMSVVVQVEVYL